MGRSRRLQSDYLLEWGFKFHVKLDLLQKVLFFILQP